MSTVHRLKRTQFYGIATACFAGGLSLSLLNRDGTRMQHNSLEEHPFVQTLKAKGYKGTDVVSRVPAFHRAHMVTTHGLAGEGKLEAAPLCLEGPAGDHYVIYYLGEDFSLEEEPTLFNRLRAVMVPHPKVAHAGIGITILDECLAACAFPNLPHHTGVTARLDVRRIANLPCGYVALHAKPGDASGRKATAEGTIYPINGMRLGRPVMRGTVVMVEPKWAKYVSWFSQGIR